MTYAQDNSTITPRRRMLSLRPMIAAVTLAHSATGATSKAIPFRWNQYAGSATAPVRTQPLDTYGQSPDTSTGKRGLSFAESVSIFSELFAKHGIAPSRKSETSDSSVLFEFLGENKACVDVYSSGVIAVIIRKGTVDEFYELDMQDAGLILSLLKDAGVSI